MNLRVGFGFDCHAFSQDVARPLKLCGVEIPNFHGLEGHSDADAPLHALTSALLGSLALGDLGHHFPSSDEQWKGKDSAFFLQYTMNLLHQRSARLSNADLTIIAQKPRLMTFVPQMVTRIAEIMGVSETCISVKITSTDYLGFIGRTEGIVAVAVAMVAIE